MSIRHVELRDSRSFNYGARGGSLTLRYLVWGSTSEGDVYEYVVANSPEVQSGFIRQQISPTHEGNGFWRTEVEYGTSGLGGGDQPTGGTPTDPAAPSSGDEPLKSGFAFQVEPLKGKITQSIRNISITTRAGRPERDFKGAIGVDKDGKVDGCDVPPQPSGTWTRTVFRPFLGFGYYRALLECAGRMNRFEWYGFPPGSLIYLGAEGTYTQGEGWSITHKFGAEPFRTNIAISDGITVPEKRGFDYIWTLYEDVTQAGVVVTQPVAAYVEQVLEEADFSIIGIGA